MRKAVTELTLAIVLAAVALAQQNKSDAEFKGLIQHYWEAWSTLNPDNVAAMYAKEADAVFFDVAPLKYNGWEEYKVGMKKVFADAASALFTPNDDLKATRRGNLAWTRNTFHGTIHQKDGKTVEIAGEANDDLGEARRKVDYCA
jgi:ketosteroid isomerase-like protein